MSDSEALRMVETHSSMAPEVATAARYELRPLSLGELLDRTFAIYRGRFWLFTGITSLSAAVQLLGNALALAGAHSVIQVQGFGAASVIRLAGQSATGLVAFLVTALIQAATVWAMVEIYMGRSATIAEALRAVRGRWLRYVGVALWQIGSAIWPAIVLGVPAALLLVRHGDALLVVLGITLMGLAFCSVGYGIWAYLRNALGVPCAVIEALPVRQAMRRSKALTRGAKGRIFVVLLVAGALMYVAAGLEMPFALLWLRSPQQSHAFAQAVMLLINFVARTLVLPIVTIGFSLVYFDQRVRLEGFDLMLMLQAVAPAAEPMPTPLAVTDAQA